MGFFDLFAPSTVRGEEAAALGYVNAGTDGRMGGSLGRAMGRTQSALSFKSDVPPVKVVEHLEGGVLFETATAPNGRQHYSLAIPRGNGRWATFRFGWRFDPNWGDEHVIGYNPNPEIVGGYIADGIVKTNATQTFIEGYRQG